MLSLSDEAKEAAPNSQVSIATTASLDNEGKQIATESTSQSEKVTISTAGSSVSDCGTVEKSQNKTARILLMPSKAHCESTEPRIAETKDAEKDGGKMYSGDKDPSEVEIRINAANLSKRERRRLRKLAHKGEGRFRNGEPRNDGHNSTHNRGDDVRSSRRRKQSLNKLGKPSKGLIAQAQLQESEYEFKQGRRYVKPYYSKFYGNAKGRWMGRTVLDVCVSEFAANPPAYYEEAIKNGRIRIARQQHHGGRKKIARQPQASSQTTAGFAHTRKKQKTGERPTNIDNNSTTTKTCITDTKFMDEIFDRLGNDYAKARDMRIVDVDYRFQRGDVLVHLTHRHEPSVICREKEGKEKEGEDWWERDVNVVYTSDRIVIVDKPASLPVHPCGRFRHNSLLYILAQQQPHLQLNPLYVVHRLDTVTSGLVVFGRSSRIANDYMHAMKSKTLQKHYLARVLGRFPCDENYQYNESHPQGVAALSPFQSSTVAYSCNDNVVGMIDVDLPIETFNVKFGIRRVVLSSTSPSSSPPLSNISSRVIKSARGHGTNALEESVERNKKAGKDQSKHARTLFRCLGYDPVTDTSLVHCQPLTGRSHQIRVHLQHIGHPIWDDSRYNQGYMLKQKRTQQTMHATTTDGTGTVSASQASVFSSTSPSSTTAHVLDPFCPSCRGDEYTKYQSYLDCIERDRRDATSNNNSTSCKETKDINAADINIDEEIESFMRVADLEEAISLHALRYDIVKQSSSSNSSEKVDRKNGDGARCKETEELINERMGIDMNAIDGSNEDGELTSFQVPWPAWAKIFTRFSSFSGQDLMRSRK